MDELFDAVRSAAERSVWTQGVELARTDAVRLDREDGDELVLKVRPAAGVIHPTVMLYPDDEAWDCDCPGQDDPCAHVAASVIALRRAAREGEPLQHTGDPGAGQIGYRLRAGAEGLHLERVTTVAGTEVELETTITALASGRVDGPRVSPTQADLAAERALGPRFRGLLPRGVVRGLLKALDGHPEVRLDDEPITVSREPVGAVAELRDAGDGGFVLQVVPDPPIERTVTTDLVVAGGALRELAPTKLDGRERENLVRGRRFEAGEAAELLAEVIPALEARMPVRVRTVRLPKTTREKPRIALFTQPDGDGLRILPSVVYGDPPVARIDGTRLVHIDGPIPLRDEAEEARLMTRLRDALGLQPGRGETLPPAEAIALLERAHQEGVARSGSGHEAFFRAPPLDVSIDVDDTALDVRFESAGRSVDPVAVLRAWRSGTSLVALDGGGFAPLPADWLERHGARLADLLAARGTDEKLPPALLPDLARFCDDLELPRPASFAALEALLGDFTRLPEPDLPSPLEDTLRAYQRQGVAWLQFLRRAELGALLADDMGLGKTLQAICALEGRSLVVAPTSVLPNWRSELERFRPELAVSLFHGAARALDGAADVTITSYALLRRDQEALAKIAWDTVVLDEAQAVKNPDSQVAQAARSLDAGFRIALSGTPVENRLDELWSQMAILNPGLLGSRRDFDETVSRPIAAGDAGAATRLRERIRPFVLRRRKAEVAPELPPRTESVLRCTLDDGERAVYDAIRAATLEDVVRALSEGGGVMAALEALLRLRQACCHAGLIPGQAATRSSKLELLRDRLGIVTDDGHKALVFSQWTGLLDRVEPVLRDAGIPFLRLDGSTRDRAAVVDAFQADDGPPVFLISLRAGGTGLNLTAADHVFLLDPWWNPAVEDQAADRAHRIGQERPVFVHRMVAADTVEERILALQDEKRRIAESALGDAAQAATLRREDLIALLDPMAAQGEDG